ncbi:MAG: iron-containing alcohol dehydrogenase [Mariniblastus sp.]|nr:iron-containing alcohol dehydrogenase [Mariniblastus sp.]
MQDFDFNLRTRMVCGAGALNRLGDLAGELGIRRALVVTDPGIREAGHVERGLDSLRRANIETCLFDEAHENPTDTDISAGVEVARRHDPELIVGLGGGSSMDCAKGINFVHSNGGRIHDYHGVGKALKPMLPMIAVPTTAGTGSEMQSFALISDAATHVKMACGDKKASCRIAILDPELTLTQPESVTALTGIDAISHAVETFVTKRRNPVSLLYSREAWRLLAGNFKAVLRNPDDLEARSAMQLGAAYAGVAIENSMLGASHALANPLTATYGTSHGQAVGLMLPHVVRFNGEQFDLWYQELLSFSEALPGLPKSDSGAVGLAEFLTELIDAAGLQVKLDQCGVQADKIPELAASAAQQWTGTFNPREVDHEALLGLYQNAF